MKIVETKTGKVIGEVITNHSMTIYEACEFAGINVLPDENGECEYDAEIDLKMVWDK
jgi:hypothetical protein